MRGVGGGPVIATARGMIEPPQQPPHALGVEPIGGLVEDQDLGIAEQGGGQGQAQAHPRGEAAHPSIGCMGELDELEDGVHPTWVDPSRHRPDPEMVAGGPSVLDAGGLQHGPHPMEPIGSSPYGRPSIVAVPPAGLTRPRSIWSVVVLPAPFRSQEPGDGAALRVEAQIVHGQQ